MAWCRWYDDALHDPKLERVAHDLEWHYLKVLGAWGGLLILANQSPVRGTLLLGNRDPMGTFDIAKALGLDETLCETLSETLVKHKLLKKTGRGLTLTNWVKRQKRSDVSTNRVREYRLRKRSETVTRNGFETRQTTDNRVQSTDVVVEGKGVVEDARATNRQLLDKLLPGRINPETADWLTTLEEEEGAGEVREVLLLALAQRPVSPKPWIAQVLINRKKERKDDGNGKQRGYPKTGRADRGTEGTRTGPDSRVDTSQYE
jgi:hypothetical protein